MHESRGPFCGSFLSSWNCMEKRRAFFFCVLRKKKCIQVCKNMKETQWSIFIFDLIVPLERSNLFLMSDFLCVCVCAFYFILKSVSPVISLEIKTYSFDFVIQLNYIKTFWIMAVWLKNLNCHHLLTYFISSAKHQRWRIFQLWIIKQHCRDKNSEAFFNIIFCVSQNKESTINWIEQNLQV